MRRRVLAHIGLLWLYARRCILYNISLSILGAGALFAVSLATTEGAGALRDTAIRSARIAWIMGALVIMTLGHLLALVAMRLFHGQELPYYRNAGLGEGALAMGAWVLAIFAGGVLLVGAFLWA